MNFHVGQKVVCVDDSHMDDEREISPLPVKGGIYTVRELAPEFFMGPSIKLAEIERQFMDDDGVIEPFHDWPFSTHRFRPLVTQSKSMDIIRSIVMDPTRKIPDDPREPVHMPVPEYDGFGMRI